MSISGESSGGQNEYQQRDSDVDYHYGINGTEIENFFSPLYAPFKAVQGQLPNAIPDLVNNGQLISEPVAFAHNGVLFDDIRCSFTVEVSQRGVFIRLYHNIQDVNSFELQIKVDGDVILPDRNEISTVTFSRTIVWEMTHVIDEEQRGWKILNYGTGFQVHLKMWFEQDVMNSERRWLKSIKQSDPEYFNHLIVLYDSSLPDFAESRPVGSVRVKCPDSLNMFWVLRYFLCESSPVLKGIFKDITAKKCDIDPIVVEIPTHIFQEVLYWSYIKSLSTRAQSDREIAEELWKYAHFLIMPDLLIELEKVLGNFLDEDPRTLSVKYFVASNLYSDLMTGKLKAQSEAYLVEFNSPDGLVMCSDLEPFANHLNGIIERVGRGDLFYQLFQTTD